MSDQNSQEPTMEEILASIRRIISEDDAPAAPAEAPAAVHEPEPVLAHEPEPEPMHVAPPEPEPEPVHMLDDDVLELTDRLDPVESLGDLDMMPVAHTPEPPVSSFREETIVSPPAATTAASAFGALHRQVLMPAEGRSLEDVTRELLRPMLQAWLDAHLPSIVQSAVEAEVDRISRQRR